MSMYTTGTAKVTVGSSVVIGEGGTEFDTYIEAGDLFKLTDEAACYDISTVNSASRLSLSTNYANAAYGNGDTLSGMSYQCVTDFTPNKNYPEMSLNDKNLPHIFTKAMRMVDSEMFAASANTLRADSYYQMGANQYIFFGSEVTESAIVAAGNAVSNSVKGSLYMSSGSGTLWVYETDSSATPLWSYEATPTFDSVKTTDYYQCGNHQYVFFGPETSKSNIVSAANAVDASVKGSIYMSSGSGKLWIFEGDSIATPLYTYTATPTYDHVKTVDYYQCGDHQYVFFGSETTEANIVAAATAVDLVIQGSLYMSDGGSLWVYTSNTTASALGTGGGGDIENFLVEHTAAGLHSAPDASSYADFATAISTIGATETTLTISESESVSSNVTVPSTLTLKFLQGGKLNIGNGYTVTINGNIEAGPYQIFTGDGTVEFGASIANAIGMRVTWWGTNRDAVQSALDSNANYVLLDTSITTATTLTYPEGIKIEGVLEYRSQNDNGILIDFSGTKCCLEPKNKATDADSHNVEFRNFSIYGNNSNNASIVGIDMSGVFHSELHNLYIYGFDTDEDSAGVHIKGAFGGYTGAATRNRFYNCRFSGNYTGVKLDGGVVGKSNETKLYGCGFTTNTIGAYVKYGSNALFSGCNFQGNSDSGILLQDKAAVITSCLFEYNTNYGIHIDTGGYYAAITGNHYGSNGIDVYNPTYYNVLRNDPSESAYWKGSRYIQADGDSNTKMWFATSGQAAVGDFTIYDYDNNKNIFAFDKSASLIKIDYPIENIDVGDMALSGDIITTGNILVNGEGYIGKRGNNDANCYSVYHTKTIEVANNSIVEFFTLTSGQGTFAGTVSITASRSGERSTHVYAVNAVYGLQDYDMVLTEIGPGINDNGTIVVKLSKPALASLTFSADSTADDWGGYINVTISIWISTSYPFTVTEAESSSSSSSGSSSSSSESSSSSSAT